MKNRASIALLVLAILLGGCDAQYQDVSKGDEYRDQVGAVCEVMVPIRAHGITNKIEKDANTDFITIWNPNAAGPEVTFSLILHPGTKMRVLAARECANCLGDRLPEYRVQVIPSPPEFLDAPAFLRVSSVVSGDVQCPTTGKGAT